CAALDGANRGHAVLGASEHCIATYLGDWAVALIAFDAVVDVVSSHGTRTIPVAELHRPPGDTPHLETTLRPDELITAIRVPATPLGRASTYLKIRDRQSYEFAAASAAAALRIGPDGMVREAKIALGGVATTPWRARAAERGLIGATLT